MQIDSTTWASIPGVPAKPLPDPIDPNARVELPDGRIGIVRNRKWAFVPADGSKDDTRALITTGHPPYTRDASGHYLVESGTVYERIGQFFRDHELRVVVL